MMKSAIHNTYGTGPQPLPPRGRAGRGQFRTGFTLMEVLIAIGILAVGGAMAAALFPAAIKESQNANSSVIGRLICENGLSNSKIVLEHSGTPPFVTAELRKPTTAIGMRDLAYPVPRQEKPNTGFDPADYPDWSETAAGVVPKSPFGNLVLGKQAIVGENDYQLAIIAYKRTAADKSGVDNGLPELYSVTFNSDAGSVEFEVTGANNKDFLRLGSPLIHAETGRFATIMSINDTKGTLDKPIAISDITGKNGWVVYDPNDTVKSPTQRVLISRTPISVP
ncbi:MAG: prepilin-type N-terminal cleavage/methylation domain-containing protein [Phycisphaerae bacterium]|nr:prepilin-type N-terminal cleavage/methylation domain-containing protein [Phycisphaerae bacterium]